MNRNEGPAEAGHYVRFEPVSRYGLSVICQSAQRYAGDRFQTD